MRTIYALMVDDTRHGPPAAIFATREDAERHLAELGDGYEIEEVPYYPPGDQPVKTTWWRASGYPHHVPWEGVYEHVHWDHYRGPVMDGEDGVLNVSEGGSGYHWCCAYDREVAAEQVRRGLEKARG